ncbi:MAG: DUF5652 family protein [Parcubacteria group bacterium]
MNYFGLVGPNYVGTTLEIILFSVFSIWSLVWKGIALWKAAKAGSKPWFIALLIINTVGILEILYIFVFSKVRKIKRADA